MNLINEGGISMKKNGMILTVVLFSCLAITSAAWADTVDTPPPEEAAKPAHELPFEEPFVLPIANVVGVEIEPTQTPLLMNGENLLFPIRPIAEKYQWDIAWNAEDQSITLTNSEDTILNNYRQATITVTV